VTFSFIIPYIEWLVETCSLAVYRLPLKFLTSRHLSPNFGTGYNFLFCGRFLFVLLWNAWQEVMWTLQKIGVPWEFKQAEKNWLSLRVQNIPSCGSLILNGKIAKCHSEQTMLIVWVNETRVIAAFLYTCIMNVATFSFFVWSFKATFHIFHYCYLPIITGFYLGANSGDTCSYLSSSSRFPAIKLKQAHLDTRQLYSGIKSVCVWIQKGLLFVCKEISAIIF
jgi:hypothetical protein